MDEQLQLSSYFIWKVELRRVQLLHQQLKMWRRGLQTFPCGPAKCEDGRPKPKPDVAPSPYRCRGWRSGGCGRWRRPPSWSGSSRSSSSGRRRPGGGGWRVPRREILVVHRRRMNCGLPDTGASLPTWPPHSPASFFPIQGPHILFEAEMDYFFLFFNGRVTSWLHMVVLFRDLTHGRWGPRLGGFRTLPPELLAN